MATQVTEAPSEIQSVNFVKDVLIEAPVEITWEAVLAEIGPEGEMPDGKPFPMKIETWPGGRWYRDLGNSAGHFWGHVQVIKPPALLELCGPMFMSFPAANHLQYRLTAEGSATRLKVTHRAMGHIPKEFRENMGLGWEHGFKRIGEIAARMKGKK